MAVLYVTEFAQMAVFVGANGQAGQMPAEPPIAEQTIAIGVSSVQSAAFNANTKFVRLHVDSTGPCSIEFGTNPTATATTQRMAPNQTEYKGVPHGAGFKVAVI